MKRYFIPILIAISMLTSGLLAGCTQETQPQETQPDNELEEFRNRLIESHQMKLIQLEQVDRELADLQAKIDETEAEYERLKELTSEMKGVHQLTREELVAGVQIEGVANKLTQLYEQEQSLLATKQSLEQDIEELERVLGKD